MIQIRFKRSAAQSRPLSPRVADSRARFHFYRALQRALPLDAEPVAREFAGMNTNAANQPSPQDILDAVVNSQEVLARGIGRIEIGLAGVKSDVEVLKADVGTLKTDVGTLKADVGTLKSDVRTLKSDMYRVERRVIRIDDRLSVIENLNPGPVLADHERRITRLEGLA